MRYLFNKVISYQTRLLGIVCSSSSSCIAFAGMTIHEAYNWRNNRQQQQPLRQWFNRSSISCSHSSSGLPSDSWLRYATAADDDDTDDGSYDDDDGDDIDIDWIIDVCKRSLVICTQPVFDADIDSVGEHGSGFRVRLFGDNLMIVTNAHVVNGCHTILLTVYYDNRICEMYGTVVYVERQLDLALIRLRVDDGDYGDNFQPRPLADYTSSGPTPIPSPGDPIVSVAHSQVANNKHPGIIRAYGCPAVADMDDWYIVSDGIDVWDGLLMLCHTARIVPGFSGGPLVDGGANIIGVNDLGCEFDLFYNITSTDTIDFIRRGQQYMTNEFRLKYAKREDSYATKSGLKLGIIVGCRRLLNNRFIIDDILPETNCSKLYIDCEIVDINGHKLTNIRQFTDTLTGLRDSGKIQLNLIENIFAVKMQPIIQVCKYRTNSPTDLIAKYGKIVGFYYGVQPMVLIADPDVAKQILVKDFQYFSERPDFFFSFNRPVMNGSLTKSRGQRWKQIRSVVTPTFSSAKLRTMTPLIDDSVNTFLKLVDKQQSTTNDGNDFNIYNLFQGLTADVIGRTAFGIQTDIQLDSDNKFIKAVKNKFKSLSIFAKWYTLIRYCFPQLYRLLYPYRRLEELINHRLLGRSPTGILLDMCQLVIDLRKSNKKQNRKDLLQLMLETKISDQQFAGLNVQLLTAGGGGGGGTGTDLQINCEDIVELKTNCQSKEAKHNDIQLTDDEIKANCVVFYEAGYETTSTALGFVAHILVNNQDIQDRIRQEVRELYETDGRLDYNTVTKLEYMECVINETMRLYPPIISFVAREANTDYTIDTNITIPKGTAVQFATYYMHHDPDYWPEPEKFDPERFSSDGSRRHEWHPYSWQPFGSGPRNCVGIRLAYFEIKLCLAKLLLNYRLEPGQRTEIGNITVNTTLLSMNPKYGVFVKVIKLF
ncbi:uncharacterized protein LOC128955168 [Oppia nitens]|uniref:uncharacterized protein LOC128955168 n=1 Tax=Oppia nitens TaxID=1686743 RepID=UPI0023DAFB2B|nr:uncharacterized protein LOC128955168 [Oppia nitens]